MPDWSVASQPAVAHPIAPSAKSPPAARSCSPARTTGQSIRTLALKRYIRRSTHASSPSTGRGTATSSACSSARTSTLVSAVIFKDLRLRQKQPELCVRQFCLACCRLGAAARAGLGRMPQELVMPTTAAGGRAAHSAPQQAIGCASTDGPVVAGVMLGFWLIAMLRSRRVSRASRWHVASAITGKSGCWESLSEGRPLAANQASPPPQAASKTWRERFRCSYACQQGCVCPSMHVLAWPLVGTSNL
jgi:hypothetical protein